MPDKDVALQFDVRLKAGIGNPSVPKLYMNGFVVSQTNADILVVAEANTAPAFLLNMSFTTAKSLAHALATTISTLEAKVGREIMTTTDISQKMVEEDVSS